MWGTNKYHMIVMTYSVRGMGGKVKWRVIKASIASEEVDFVCIQETKLSKIEKKCVRQYGEMGM